MFHAMITGMYESRFAKGQGLARSDPSMLRSSGFQDLVRKGRIKMAKLEEETILRTFLRSVCLELKISEISRRLGFFVESRRSNIVDTASVGVN